MSLDYFRWGVCVYGQAAQTTRGSSESRASVGPQSGDGRRERSSHSSSTYQPSTKRVYLRSSNHLDRIWDRSDGRIARACRAEKYSYTFQDLKNVSAFLLDAYEIHNPQYVCPSALQLHMKIRLSSSSKFMNRRKPSKHEFQEFVI